jgi:hypothetical protein
MHEEQTNELRPHFFHSFIKTKDGVDKHSVVMLFRRSSFIGVELGLLGLNSCHISCHLPSCAASS